MVSAPLLLIVVVIVTLQELLSGILVHLLLLHVGSPAHAVYSGLSLAHYGVAWRVLAWSRLLLLAHHTVLWLSHLRLLLHTWHHPHLAHHTCANHLSHLAHLRLAHLAHMRLAHLRLGHLLAHPDTHSLSHCTHCWWLLALRTSCHFRGWLRLDYVILASVHILRSYHVLHIRVEFLQFVQVEGTFVTHA